MIGEQFGEVLRLARAGDQHAFEVLYRDLAPAVLRFAYARGVADPEDTLGDVMESMVRSLARFQGDEAAFRAWVFTIAYRRVADKHRKAARSVRQQQLVSADQARSDDTPESELMGRIYSGPLGTALSRLTPDQRDVLVLRFAVDLPLEATAMIVNKRVSAVKMLQARALERVRDLLGEIGQDGFGDAGEDKHVS